MSTDDNLFARWSRRKQAARSGEIETPVEEAHALDAPADQAQSCTPLPQPVPTQAEAEEAEAAEPAEPLPRIEDLTAESDLAVFLRKGVPKALRSAAMRKMWSLDPVIRDHVGLAENSWDFNKPGSMPGFGPLEAKERVVAFLSTIGRAMEADATENAGTQAASAAAPPPRDADSSAEAQPDPLVASTNSRSADESVEPQSLVGDEPAPTHNDIATGSRKQSTEPEQPPARPRHGSALPR